MYFQYPRTDRGVCNSPARARCHPIPAPFSILERIVVCATTMCSRGPSLHAGLSVSSNGSWCVQPEICAPESGDVLAFSILERIVVCATRRSHRIIATACAFSILERIVVCATVYRHSFNVALRVLSVSSNGSWCVQHSRRPGRRAVFNFQYPRTDRGVCNSAPEAQPTATPCPFSILERIVVCATPFIR